MNKTALVAALLALATSPAFAQTDLPMDEHDEFGAAASTDAALDTALGTDAAVSATVETTVKTTLEGAVDTASGMGVITNSNTVVITSVTTQVAPTDGTTPTTVSVEQHTTTSAPATEEHEHAIEGGLPY